MPYLSNVELPKRIREGMPAAAQSIFRNVFNSVMDEEGATEASAFAQAYGALENAGYYQNTEGNWIKKSESFLYLLNKFNPHHGKDGRFSSGSGGGGKSKNLTSSEKSAIEHYTSDGFLTLNKNLRENTLSSSDKKTVEQIDSGLDKIKNHDGITYRAVNFGNEKMVKGFVNAHLQGGPVTYNQYLSTSQNSNLFGGFGGKDNVSLIVHGKKGKDISKYSNNPHEKEVLFKHGTSFLVKSVKVSNFGHYTIEIKEVT